MPALNEERKKRSVEFNYRVGTNIRVLREALDVSQQWLAEQADISKSHLSRIEAGERALSLQQGLSIAEALGVLPYELTGSERFTRSVVSRLASAA